MSGLITLEEYKKIEIPLSYSRDPRLNRVHIGLVLLSTDHSLEYEWSKIIGDHALTFSSRIAYNGNMKLNDLKSLENKITNCSNQIATGLAMDVMAFACTSASMAVGEDKVKTLLTVNRGDIPATNPWTAAKAAFRYLGAKKIAIFSPYPSEVNYFLFKQLMNEGFEVNAIAAARIMKDMDISHISKTSMTEGLERVLAKADADLVFMPCTNLRVFDHLQALEERFNLPIVTSNSALFWHAMHLLDRTINCQGYGRLLSGGF